MSLRRGDSNAATTNSNNNSNNNGNGWTPEVPSYYMTSAKSSSSLSNDGANNNDSSSSNNNNDNDNNNGNGKRNRLKPRRIRKRPFISIGRPPTGSTSGTSYPPYGTNNGKNYNSNNNNNSNFLLSFLQRYSVYVAVLLWYLLGVTSIATSKVLLSELSVPPLWLTLQQLSFGATYLRTLLHFRVMGSAGLQPWPAKPRNYHPPNAFHLKDLLLAGVYFTVGFLTTNLSFQGASAAFVETAKAAEPITSASVAVAFGIELLSRKEAYSLAVIVMGVLLSTLGNSNQGGTTTTTDDAIAALDDDNTIPQMSTLVPYAAIQSCAVVMVSNLCFSFRGLHQKLFRAQPFGSAAMVDDLNLQFRMQLTGVCLLTVPVLLLEGSTVWSVLWYGSGRSLWLRYLYLSTLNGFAFTSYK